MKELMHPYYVFGKTCVSGVVIYENLFFDFSPTKKNFFFIRDALCMIFFKKMEMNFFCFCCWD
jgi:hypothetical protein